MRELPRGWALTTLGAIGEYLNGRGFKKTEWREAGRPIIRIQNLTGTSKEFNYFEGDPGEGYLAQKGDILVSWAATLGVFVWDGPEAVINQHIFKVKSHIDQRFHRYLLQFVLSDLKRQTHGSGMVHITKSRFESTPVLLPPYREQKRMVLVIEEQLSRIDAGVAALERVRQNLRRMRAAVLEAAITGALVHDDASCWDTRQLATLGVLDRGKSRHRPRNDPVLYGGPFPFIQTGDVAAADPWIDRHSQTYNSLGLEQSRLWPSGTLCITIAANIAKSGLLTFDACFPDSVVGFMAHDGPIATRWVELVIRSMQDRLEQLAPATAQKNINLSVLRVLEIPYPNPTYQSEVLSEYDRQMSLLGALDRAVAVEEQHARGLRSSILAAAFSGRLVPQDLGDEPASMLLKRMARHSSSNGHRSTEARGQRRRKIIT